MLGVNSAYDAATFILEQWPGWPCDFGASYIHFEETARLDFRETRLAGPTLVEWAFIARCKARPCRADIQPRVLRLQRFKTHAFRRQCGPSVEDILVENRVVFA